MKKVLVMCNPDPSGNPRPRRVIELCLSLGFRVDILSAPIHGDIKYHNSYTIRKHDQTTPILKRYLHSLIVIFGILIFKINLSNRLRVLFHNYRFFLNNMDFIKKNSYDLIIVEELTLLPFAISNKRNSKVIFDAREYYPKQLKATKKYKFMTKPVILWICSKYLAQCDKVLTVSYGLADEYKKEYHVNPIVIRSTPKFHSFDVKPVNPSSIKIVHHGNAVDLRRLDKLIDLIKILDERFTLNFYLNANTKDRLSYVNQLKEYSKGCNRVVFRKAVPFNDIIKTLNRYDIGLFYVEPTTFNLKHTLPNKFFEFIQARLMIAIGPTPDMAMLVNEYDCGVVSTKFDIAELAAILNNLTTEDIMTYKHNSANAAKYLCFEVEGEKLYRIIKDLLN